MRKLVGILLIAIGLFILVGIGQRILPFPAKTVEKSIALDSTKTVTITMDSENVQIIPEKRDDIKVALYKKGFQRDGILTSKHGDKIAIGIKNKGWHWLFNWGAAVKIHIPKDYAEALDVNMGSGNFAFDGKTMEMKNLVLNITSGNARVNDILVDRLSGDVHSGNISLEQIKAGVQAHIKVRSGNVAIKHFSGPLYIDTSSGNVTAQVDTLEKDITVNTRSGNIRLNIPEDAGYRINAELKSGNIKNLLPLKVTMSGSNYLAGTHGNGSSLITIKGWSGNVKLY